MWNPITALRHSLSINSHDSVLGQWVGMTLGYPTFAQRNLALFWKYYRSNEMVFAATTETTRASSVIPQVVETFQNGRWQLEMADNPIQMRLEHPNSDQDGVKFREEGDTELVVTGNSVTVEWPVNGFTADRIALPPMPDEPLGEFRNIPTANVMLRRGEHGRIVEYIYDPEKRHGGHTPTLVNTPSATAFRFAKQRVIHRTYAPDPGEQDWGLGPVAAALDAIEADVNITAYIREFFKQGAVPPHIFLTEATMSPEQEKQLQRRWANNVGGVENAWRLAVMAGAKGTIQRLGLAAGSREVGLDDLRKATEARILVAMNVPPIVIGAPIGLENATYSNYDQARQAMHEENTDPLVTKRDATWTHYFRNRLSNPSLRIRADTTNVLAVQMRQNQRSEQATRELQSGLTMRGEARSLAGYAPSAGDDIFFVPLNLEMLPGSVVDEGRVRKLSLNLADHEASAVVIREQAWETASTLGIQSLPEGVISHVMLNMSPRQSTESKQQYAYRILLSTHHSVYRYRTAIAELKEPTSVEVARLTE